VARAQKISPILAQCLINRGITEEAAISGFLDPRLKSLSDPFLLKGMHAAVERLFRARDQGEPLVIFGDYDVDGVTSTVLLLEVFNALGLKANFYLPHRLDEGYGLTDDGISNCLEKHPCKLVVAVDCGSCSTTVITALRERGVDVIVLDHHQPADPLPPALAIINPHIPCEGTAAAQPFTELCSAGLAFKLAHALVKRGREQGLPEALSFDVRTLLEFVALGTIADVVPLIRENRILVPAGLDRLSKTSRPGLVALKQVAQCPAKVGTQEVGFQLAPRLNAAGRLETAATALELLRSKTITEALVLAEQLNQSNQERQGIERGIADAAVARIEQSFKPENDFVIIEGDPNWHIGVVGIVASRVLQRFYRPTIILGGDGIHLRGSGRSVMGFDLAGALRDCGDLLVRHGGHAMAAGVTIEPAKVNLFRERLNEVARKCIGSEALRPSLRLDAEISLGEISLGLMAVLDKLRPHGNSNPVPRFFSVGLTHARPLQRMGASKQHVRMWVTDGATTQEAVWWGAGEGQLPVGTFDLAFEPCVNHYNGRSTPQLKVLDWRGSATGADKAQLQL
jgi:single-stranded-DNA-specific exonuclease